MNTSLNTNKIAHLSAAQRDAVRAAAGEYLAAGWSLVPIVSGSKGPRESGWNRPENCVNTPEDVQRVNNVGLAHAYSGTCAIDIDDFAQSRVWLSLHGIDLDELWNAPDAVRIVNDRPNRGKLLYRRPVDAPLLRTRRLAEAELEFRCASGSGFTLQDVLPPSLHPGGGGLYRWDYADEMVGDWRHLPELPAHVMKVWMDTIGVTQGWTDAAAEDGFEALMVSEPPLDVTSGTLVGWLADIDPDGIGYDSWLRVGMALHHQFGGSREGLNTWIDWTGPQSEQGRRTPDILEYKWGLFGRGTGQRVTARYIRRLAAPRLDAEKEPVKPKDPFDLAGRMLSDRYETEAGRTFYRCGGDWLRYAEQAGAYQVLDDEAMRGEAWNWCAAQTHVINTGTEKKPVFETVAVVPQPAMVSALLDALAARARLEADELPTWAPGYEGPAADELIVTSNGVLHAPSRAMTPHTPGLVCINALPYAYDPNAACPSWDGFLRGIFAHDPEQYLLLQEIAGYLVSGRTDAQKIFMLFGPKRSGKGTILRILSSLMGQANVGSATIQSLGTNFGLESTIGKSLVMLPDFRVAGRSEQLQAVVERLLMISGEDVITIDRKHAKAWTGRMRARVIMAGNEFPVLGDASGALASRFVSIELKESFFSREDLGLGDRLANELPGILNWALEGLDRLNRVGHFTKTVTQVETAKTLALMSSPMSEFIEDHCELGPEHTVFKDDFVQAYRSWLGAQGLQVVSSVVALKALYATEPHVRSVRSNREHDRRRALAGLRLRADSGFDLL